jgi:hypothetical protein
MKQVLADAVAGRILAEWIAAADARRAAAEN